MRRVTLKETSPGSNVYFGSGDVFTDLGFPDAEEMRVKVQLGVAINNILESRNLTPKDAAKLLSVKKTKLAALQGYKLDKFSVSKLLTFVTALEHHVTIELLPDIATKAA